MLKIAIQMDRLESLYIKWDTTLELARVAIEKGFEVFHYEPKALRLDVNSDEVIVTATGYDLIYTEGEQMPWKRGEAKEANLSNFNIIFMRQDPPFDLAYITATHFLEHLQNKVRIINNPVSVRNSPEKLLVTHFPHLMPPTLITRDINAIQKFRQKHGKIILKPLFNCSGRSIFCIKKDDGNFLSIWETISSLNNEPWIVQRYLPVERCGDKRVVLLNGEPIGCFNRKPVKGDIRGNLRIGATKESTTLTKHDKYICETLKPVLRDQGLYLVGIDIIGNYLTEINVTSPTGFVFCDVLEGRIGKARMAEQFWNMLLA